MKYEVKRTKEEIDRVMVLVDENRAYNGAFHENYERGIYEFAAWLFGETDEPPLE